MLVFHSPHNTRVFFFGKNAHQSFAATVLCRMVLSSGEWGFAIAPQPFPDKSTTGTGDLAWSFIVSCNRICSILCISSKFVLPNQPTCGHLGLFLIFSYFLRLDGENITVKSIRSQNIISGCIFSINQNESTTQPHPLFYILPSRRNIQVTFFHRHLDFPLVITSHHNTQFPNISWSPGMARKTMVLLFNPCHQSSPWPPERIFRLYFSNYEPSIPILSYNQWDELFSALQARIYLGWRGLEIQKECECPNAEKEKMAAETTEGMKEC